MSSSPRLYDTSSLLFETLLTQLKSSVDVKQLALDPMQLSNIYKH